MTPTIIVLQKQGGVWFKYQRVNFSLKSIYLLKFFVSAPAGFNGSDVHNKQNRHKDFHSHKKSLPEAESIVWFRL